jgi:hypothetical protein
MDEKFLISIISGLVGAIVTLLAVFLTALLGRYTFVSNRVFDLRVEALNNILRAFNEMKGYFAFRQQLGFPKWHMEYREKAIVAIHEFRRAIDNSQIVLPASVFESFREIDSAYYLFLDDEKQNWSELAQKVNLICQRMIPAINRTLRCRTHKVSLASWK